MELAPAAELELRGAASPTDASTPASRSAAAATWAGHLALLSVRQASTASAAALTAPPPALPRAKASQCRLKGGHQSASAVARSKRVRRRRPLPVSRLAA